jgi:hypothetical protein
MELDDPLAEQLRSNISAILDANLAGPAALLSSFAEVQQELDAAGGAGGHLVGWLAGDHSLQDTAAEIERLLQVRLILVASLCAVCACFANDWDCLASSGRQFPICNGCSRCCVLLSFCIRCNVVCCSWPSPWMPRQTMRCGSGWSLWTWHKQRRGW